MSEQNNEFSGWAKVEIMGKQVHLGFVKTEVYGQAVMFRVDTPQLPERQYVLESPAFVDGKWCPAGTTVLRVALEGCSVLIGSGSIYRLTPCTEAACMRAIEMGQRAELKLISLPEAKALGPSGVDPYDDDDDDSNETGHGDELDEAEQAGVF